MVPPPRDPNRKPFPAISFVDARAKVQAALQQQIAAENITPAELAPPPTVVIPVVAGAEYIAGQDYLYELPHKTSIWVNGPDWLFEVKLLHLLQTDKDIKTLYKNQLRQLKATKTMRSTLLLAPSVSALDKSITALDGALELSYEDAYKTLESDPNPLLLKQLLSHYYLYVDSQNARWPSVIDSLSKIDPAVNLEAANEVKALREANKDSEPGFRYGK